MPSIQLSRWLFYLLTGLVLSSCRVAEPLTPTAEPAPALPATMTATSEATPVSATWPAPVATADRRPPTAEPSLTPSATATMTPTTRPTLVLAVPPRWTEAVGAAVAEFQDSQWAWQVVAAGDPAAALAAGQAQVALVASAEGVVVGQRPLVLAVPFTTRWEEVTQAQAEQILAAGHEVVRVMEWSALEPAHKALRVDGLRPADPGYPLQQSWSLAAAPEMGEAARALAAYLQPIIEQDTVVHLAAVGDIMLDRTLGRAIENGALEWPFALVASVLQAADVTVGNLECALGDVGQPALKSYTFQAPPAAAEALALAGFDVMSLANNHALDYGPDALLQGIGLLRQQGVTPVGAGANEAEARAPYFMEVNGLRLAFLGYVNVPIEGSGHGFDTSTWTATAATPGLAWGYPSWIATDVTAARQQADLVIVILHSGYEYLVTPSPEQTAAVQAAVDAGATLVLGHHPHILDGIEFFQSAVYASSLGNFAFTIDGPPETAILNVWLDEDGVRQLEIVPAIIQVGGQPRLATPVEAAAIQDTVYRLTTP